MVGKMAAWSPWAGSFCWARRRAAAALLQAIHADEKPGAAPVAGQVRGIEREGGIEFVQRGIEALETRFALGELAQGGRLPAQVVEGFGGARRLPLGATAFDNGVAAKAKPA